MKIAIALLGCALTSFTSPALADGEFLQLDLGQETQGLVATVTRGNWSYGGNVTVYDSGKSGAIQATYGLPVGQIATARLGPTIGFDDPDNEPRDYEIGALLSLERYAATGFGGIFGMAQASSINEAWFILGQASFARSGLAVELSRGGSDSYRETTLAVQKKLGDGPYSLRAGYKLDSDEAFIGISFNTF